MLFHLGVTRDGRSVVLVIIRELNFGKIRRASESKRVGRTEREGGAGWGGVCVGDRYRNIVRAHLLNFEAQFIDYGAAVIGSGYSILCPFQNFGFVGRGIELIAREAESETRDLARESCNRP